MSKFIAGFLLILAVVSSQAAEVSAVQFDPIRYYNPFINYAKHYDQFDQGRCSVLLKHGLTANGDEVMQIYFAQAPGESSCIRMGQLYGQFTSCRAEAGEVFGETKACYRVNSENKLEVVRYHEITGHLEFSIYSKEKGNKAIHRYFARGRG